MEQGRLASIHVFFAGALLLMAASARAAAAVDVILYAPTQEVVVGDPVLVEVIIASDSSENELVAAMELIFEWQSDHLHLLGLDDTGAVPLLFSGFPPSDPYNINGGMNPPEGGLGFYQAWAALGNRVVVGPDGVLLTTFLFEAVSPTGEGGTAIGIVEEAGDPTGETIVYDGVQPNTDITGALIGTSVVIVPEPATCPWDLNDDSLVNVADLLLLLGVWGDCDDIEDCPGDVNSDGTVNVTDLLLMLGAWGACP